MAKQKLFIEAVSSKPEIFKKGTIYFVAETGTIMVAVDDDTVKDFSGVSGVRYEDDKLIFDLPNKTPFEVDYSDFVKSGNLSNAIDEVVDKLKDYATNNYVESTFVPNGHYISGQGINFRAAESKEVIEISDDTIEKIQYADSEVRRLEKDKVAWAYDSKHHDNINILLKEDGSVLAPIGGNNYNLVKGAEYGDFKQVEVGSSAVHLNLNSDDRPTVETPYQKKSVAYLDEVSEVSDKLDTYSKKAQDIAKQLSNEITKERDTRISEVSRLEDGLNNATKTCQESKERLEAELNEEKERAKQAEAEIAANLTSEINRATTAEQNLSNAIEDEKTRAKGVEKEISDKLDATESKLDETVKNAFNKDNLVEGAGITITNSGDGKKIVNIDNDTLAAIRRASNDIVELAADKVPWTLGKHINLKDGGALIATVGDENVNLIKGTNGDSKNVEIGSLKTHTNINSVDRPTISMPSGNEEIAFKSDISESADLEYLEEELAKKANVEDLKDLVSNSDLAAQKTELNQNIDKVASSVETLSNSVYGTSEGDTTAVFYRIGKLEEGLAGEHQLRDEQKANMDKALDTKVSWAQNPDGSVLHKIVLPNDEGSITGTTQTGEGAQLLSISKWNKAEVGSSKVDLNLNSKDRPTVNDSEQIAYLSDITDVNGDVTEVKSDIDDLKANKVDKSEIEDMLTNTEADAKFAVKEDIVSVDGNDKILFQDGTTIKSQISIDYNDTKIQLKGVNGAVFSEIDASEFIKDSVLDDVDYDAETKVITLTFNIESGKKPLTLDVSDLVDEYTAGLGLNLVAGEFSVNTDVIATKEHVSNTYQVKGDYATKSEVEAKADKTYVDSALEDKADAADFSDLNSKVSDLENNKADKTEISDMLTKTEANTVLDNYVTKTSFNESQAAQDAKITKNTEDIAKSTETLNKAIEDAKAAAIEAAQNYADSKIDDIPVDDFVTNEDLTTELDDIKESLNEKISRAEVESTYATIEDLDEKADANDLNNLDSKVTELESTKADASDLENYVEKEEYESDKITFATKDDIEDMATEEWVNTQGFLTEVPSEYITNDELESYDYATKTELASGLGTKQDTLVSGTNIKTINGNSVLGDGNIEVVTDLSDYYTKGDIDDKLSGKADSGDYATKTDVATAKNEANQYTDSKIDELNVESLATKEEIKDMETQTHASQTYQVKGDYALKSEIPTDYVSNEALEQKNYTTKSYVDGALDKKADKTEIPSLDGYATEDWVGKQGYLTDHQSLEEYAKKTEVTAEISTAVKAGIDSIVDGASTAMDTLKEVEEALKESGDTVTALNEAIGKKADKTELESAVDDMATMTWVTNQNYLTDHQSLDEYAKTADVDNKLKDYYTKSEVDSAVESVSNQLDGYVQTGTFNTELNKKADKSEIPSLEGYAKETYVDSAIEELNVTQYETITGASEKYQVKGEYLTEHQSLDNYYNKGEVDKKITEAVTDGKVDLDGYATEQWVNDQNYLTSIPENYVTTNDLESKNYASQDSIDSINQEISEISDTLDSKADTSALDAYLTKNEASTTYQTAGDYATKTDIADMLSSTEAEETYQKIGDYVTNSTLSSTLNDYVESSEIEDMLTKTEAAELYQPAGDYLTDTDIADMLTKSEAGESYYDKTTVDSKVGAVDTKVTNLTTEVDKKQDKLTAGDGIKITDGVISSDIDLTIYKVVTSLPEDNIDDNKIYLVLSESTSSTEGNIYTEYVHVNNTWEEIGVYKAAVDLNPYLTKESASETYATKIELGNKADSATTLEGYGIEDAYISNRTIHLGDESLDVPVDVSNDLNSLTSKVDTLEGSISDIQSSVSELESVMEDGSVKNAATADKLSSTVTLWGQEFDGSDDVDGDITVNGTVSAESIAVSSNALVTNLNADMIDGKHLEDISTTIAVDGQGALTLDVDYDKSASKVTITGSIADVTKDASGLMTPALMTKVDSIDTLSQKVSDLESNSITELPVTNYDTLGGVYTWCSHTVKATGSKHTSDPTKVEIRPISTNNDRYYGIESDVDGRLFVNVPWTDTETTYTGDVGIDVIDKRISLAASGVDANNYGPDFNAGNNTNVSWGGTINVPSIAVDGYGRITKAANTQIALPNTPSASSIGALTKSDVSAEGSDALTLSASANGDGVKITGSVAEVSSSASGLMTSGDKSKLDELYNNKDNVPTASDSAVGGIKTGFTATGAKVPVQLSDDKAYVELTAAAVSAASTNSSKLLTYAAMSSATVAAGNIYYNTTARTIAASNCTGFSLSNPDAVVYSTQKLTFTKSASLIPIDGIADLEAASSGTSRYIYCFSFMPTSATAGVVCVNGAVYAY